MSVEAQKDDYLIVRDGSKSKMLRVLSVKKGLIQGVVEDDTDEQENLEVSPDDVLANLGLNPSIGKVYQSNTERLISVDDDPFWGELHWLFVPTDETKEMVEKALRAAAKKLKQKNLTSWKSHLRCIKLRYLLGNTKHAGLYKCKRSRDDEPSDEIHIKVNEVTVSDLEYVLLHESAHGIDARSLHNEKARRAWIRHFANLTKFERVDEDTVRDVVESVLEEKGTDHLTDEQSKLFFDGPYADFLAAHALKERDFYDLLENATEYLRDRLTPFIRAVVVSEQTTDSTEYSKTNVAEYFAEAMTGHVFFNQTLSDKTETLIAKTLTALEG